MSLRKFKRLKSTSLAILAAAASVSAAGAIATTLGQPTPITEPSRPVIADTAQAVTNIPTKKLRRLGIGPGVHTFTQRKLSGLEIRAVRVAASKRAIGTNRTGRSKYTGNGVPCRVTKLKSAQV